MKPTILVHGGAGQWPLEKQKQGLLGVKNAAQAGYDVLKKNGTALDAVQKAIRIMEDNPAFNAGLGSSLNLDRKIEMEASIMDGKTLNAGATALLADVKNPIELASRIMENTDHVFIVGQAAQKLAEFFNLKRRDPTTKPREKYWIELSEKMKKNELKYLPKMSKLLEDHPTLFQSDTVGAVAVDKQRDLAAGTSTGGLAFKIPGRIGDSPIIGCGNYADNETGACSATGIGEIAIKLVLAKTTCDYIGNGQTPQQATETSIKQVNRRIQSNPNQMGLIAIDATGRIGAAHNSNHMLWAYMTPKTSHAEAYPKAIAI